MEDKDCFGNFLSLVYMERVQRKHVEGKVIDCSQVGKCFILKVRNHWYHNSYFYNFYKEKKELIFIHVSDRLSISMSDVGMFDTWLKYLTGS